MANPLCQDASTFTASTPRAYSVLSCVKTSVKFATWCQAYAHVETIGFVSLRVKSTYGVMPKVGGYTVTATNTRFLAVFTANRICGRTRPIPAEWSVHDAAVWKSSTVAGTPDYRDIWKIRGSGSANNCSERQADYRCRHRHAEHHPPPPPHYRQRRSHSSGSNLTIRRLCRAVEPHSCTRRSTIREEMPATSAYRDCSQKRRT